jgi:tetratricopeptide (TPR) repeat protein
MREAWNRLAWLAWLLALLIVASAAPVAAQKKKPEAKAESSASSSDEVARGLFQAGKAAYEAGNYADALDFFEQAHQRSGRPELLFNIGQAADRLRQDDKAIEALRAYVTQLPDAANRGEVEARIRALEAARTERKNAEAVAPVTPQPTAAAAVPTPEETAQQAAAPESSDVTSTEGEPAASKPVTKQWWFWTGIGAVVVGGTAVALAVALGADDGGREPYYEGNGGSLQGP